MMNPLPLLLTIIGKKVYNFSIPRRGMCMLIKGEIL